MRIGLLILAGLTALAFGLVTRMPAAVVADWADANIPGLTVSGATGTALDGRVGRLLYRDLPLQGIRWQIHPWPLLWGEVRAGIRVATDAGGVVADLSYSLLDGDLSLSHIAGSASFDWLAQRAGYTFIPVSGRLSVDLERVRLTSEGQIAAIRGHAAANNIHWQLIRPPALLGRLGADIRSESGTITIEITDSDGPLALQGSAVLQASNIYQLDVRLRARSSADPRLKQLLTELGDADANGWYHIRTQGRL